MTKASTPTKAELLEMLAEAVRNTQPESVRDAQPAPKRNPRARKRGAPKCTAKTKSVRTSASRKR
jgi:hypothetical protein